LHMHTVTCTHTHTRSRSHTHTLTHSHSLTHMRDPMHLSTISSGRKCDALTNFSSSWPCAGPVAAGAAVAAVDITVAVPWSRKMSQKSSLTFWGKPHSLQRRYFVLPFGIVQGCCSRVGKREKRVTGLPRQT
jgi:hypothetical protein